MRYTVWSIVPIVVISGAARGAERKLKAQRGAVDPAVERVLGRLEKTDVRDISTPVTLIKRDPVLEDEQKQIGTLRFKQDKPNPRFLIVFDKNVNAGVVDRKKEWHAFDGKQWYTEARESTKTIVKREILRPGDKLEVFELGKGPFPLPFGQKKDESLKHFVVTLVPPAKDDPPETDHLACTPLPVSELANQFKFVHFYVHKKLDLPVRIHTVSSQTAEEIVVDLPADKIKLNEGLASKDLDLPKLPSEYPVTTEPLPPPDVAQKP